MNSYYACGFSKEIVTLNTFLFMLKKHKKTIRGGYLNKCSPGLIPFISNIPAVIRGFSVFTDGCMASSTKGRCFFDTDNFSDKSSTN